MAAAAAPAARRPAPPVAEEDDYDEEEEEEEEEDEDWDDDSVLYAVAAAAVAAAAVAAAHLAEPSPVQRTETGTLIATRTASTQARPFPPGGLAAAQPDAAPDASDRQSPTGAPPPPAATAGSEGEQEYYTGEREEVRLRLEDPNQPAGMVLARHELAQQGLVGPLFVSELVPDSPASRAGVREGAIIHSIAGAEVHDMPSAAAAMGSWRMGARPGDSLPMELVHTLAKDGRTPLLGMHDPRHQLMEHRSMRPGLSFRRKLDPPPPVKVTPDTSGRSEPEFEEVEEYEEEEFEEEEEVEEEEWESNATEPQFGPMPEADRREVDRSHYGELVYQLSQAALRPSQGPGRVRELPQPLADSEEWRAALQRWQRGALEREAAARLEAEGAAAAAGRVRGNPNAGRGGIVVAARAVGADARAPSGPGTVINELYYNLAPVPAARLRELQRPSAGRGCPSDPALRPPRKTLRIHLVVSPRGVPVGRGRWAPTAAPAR